MPSASSSRQRAPVAITTDRASTCWPSSRSTRTRPSGPSASSTTRWKLDSTASKRRACSVALRVSSVPEIAAREAEVVLDPRAGPGLAARRPGLGDERPQPLRAAVDRGREAGRAAAEHDEVEALAVDLGAQAERASDLRRRGVAHHVRGVHEHRRLLARDVEPLEERGALVVRVDVVQAHRQQVALEQVADLERPARAARRRSGA